MVPKTPLEVDKLRIGGEPQSLINGIDLLIANFQLQIECIAGFQ